MAITTYIFDLDGTLVDSSPGAIRAFNLFLAKKGQYPADDESIRETISAGAATTITNNWQDPLTDVETESLRQEYLAFYAAQPDPGSTIYPGIRDCLHQLKTNGIAIGVVTNKIEQLAYAVMEQTELLELMDIVVCGDHVSHRKPDPEGLFKAIQSIDADPDNCVYVGDHLKDIITAQRAGIRSIAVAYGFKPADDNYRNWPADWFAETPADLCKQLSALI